MIFILYSHLRRICMHGDEKTGEWFDDTIITAYMHLLQLRANARVRGFSMKASSGILRGGFETAAKGFRLRSDNHLLTDYDWIFLVFNIKSP